MASATSPCFNPLRLPHVIRPCVCKAHAHYASARQCAIASPSASHLQVPTCAALHRRRTGVRSSAALNDSGSIQLVSNAVSLAVAACAAYLLTNRQEEKGLGGEQCPRCNGTGKETCFCSRWSDGDKSGCPSCNYTGYTVCKACGGGGNAVPIPIAIRKHENARNQYDQDGQQIG
eukprot:TRINITY_DN7205_c0_g2_i1.p1 TRINITY_DN7205_c0_g2~~TRINITY_DN7205_c0_g2_i1.p1  ORF type:complete len:175 (-),score=1.75 TRINITY_DN7205_c0_g2_i1:373-897(-)